MAYWAACVILPALQEWDGSMCPRSRVWFHSRCMHGIDRRVKLFIGGLAIARDRLVLILLRQSTLKGCLLSLVINSDYSPQLSEPSNCFKSGAHSLE